MSLVMPVTDGQDKHVGWLAYCPGCDHLHHYDLRWTFNGNVESPTFEPSYLATTPAEPPKVCHSFLRNDVFEFCSDSTHQYAGQQIPIRDIESYR